MWLIIWLLVLCWILSIHFLNSKTLGESWTCLYFAGFTNRELSCSSLDAQVNYGRSPKKIPTAHYCTKKKQAPFSKYLHQSNWILHCRVYNWSQWDRWLCNYGCHGRLLPFVLLFMLCLSFRKHLCSAEDGHMELGKGQTAGCQTFAHLHVGFSNKNHRNSFDTKNHIQYAEHFKTACSIICERPIFSKEAIYSRNVHFI